MPKLKVQPAKEKILFGSPAKSGIDIVELKVTAEDMADGGEDLPRDAKIVKTLLNSMGVEDHEPRVVHQFLELWYRYVVDVLTDAQVYSEHAGKGAIDSEDVKLAIQSKVNSSFSQPPPREVLLELARTRNKIPLPTGLPAPGIPLPPEQDTLISPNYQLAIIPRKQQQTTTEQQQAVEEMEEDEEETVNPTKSDPPPQEPQDTEMPQSTSTHQLEEHSELPQSSPHRVSFAIGEKRPRS